MACSLVCSFWSASSRYHLFQNACTIHVHRRNFQEFCELLAGQRLNAYIGRLHLESHIIDEECDGRPDETFQFNEHLKCLSGLPHLKYLHLDYHHDSILPEFLAAFTQNFASITDLEFTSMHFNSFTQFVQVVDSLPLLRRVTLDDVSFYDCRSDSDSDNSDILEENIPRPTYTPTALTDVVASCNYEATVPVLWWLLSQPLIRRLAISIDQRYREEHTVLLSNALNTLGPRLEHLILKDADNSHLPDLSHTTGLHTFQITGIQCLQTSTSVDLEWVPMLLSQLHSPGVQRIVFVVDLRDRAGLDLLDWPRIRNILAGLSSLQHVQFFLSAHKKWAMKAIAEHLLPRVYALQVEQLVGRYRYSLSLFDH
ncbi:hypothetical protein MVEN_00204100 [Mycena venus]|uniref:Uncharacterized protein n=1 Tax=Mycena venus TaxID=2733690 RepID=A0A8H6YXA4_9AGAR|nr:hypothetical protein MVEN_00204100 [Mycena venus]